MFSPFGAESFDIGEVGEQDRDDIPLASIKPVFVRSKFQDEDELEDVLGLSKLLDEALNHLSISEDDQKIIFIDARGFPDAYTLSGLYKKEKDLVKLRLKIKSTKMSQEYVIEGKSTDEILDKVLIKVDQVAHSY